jgi:type I restriction enzyme M protein
MQEFLTLQQTKAESEHSWTLDVNTLDDACDLSVKNPNKVEVVDERTPNEIAESIFALGQENQTLINEIMEMVK